MENQNLSTATALSSNSPSEVSALQAIIGALHSLDDEARKRILDSAATFLRVDMSNRGHIRQSWTSTPSSSSHQPKSSSHLPKSTGFSEDTSMSPKEFLHEKQPKTDVERIACLAYFLTHYRETPHFKTAELSILNTEAAQPKFANTAYATSNAVKLGYLVPSTKGQRQLSAVGERFVHSLPDREAAKAVLATLRRRSKAKRVKNSENSREHE